MSADAMTNDRESPSAGIVCKSHGPERTWGVRVDLRCKLYNGNQFPRLTRSSYDVENSLVSNLDCSDRRRARVSL